MMKIIKIQLSHILTISISQWFRQGYFCSQRDIWQCLEGNGNPLQCSCLENPRDGGAWWAAVYGVAQSRTRLKRLSSSSSRNSFGCHNWHLWVEARAAAEHPAIYRTASNNRVIQSKMSIVPRQRNLVYPLHPGLFRSIHPYTELRIYWSVVRRTFNCSYQDILFLSFFLRWQSSLRWWKGRYWLMFFLFAFSWSQTKG